MIGLPLKERLGEIAQLLEPRVVSVNSFWPGVLDNSKSLDMYDIS